MIYDIEVFPNTFHCVILNTDNEELYKFEISERKNQIRELVQFFTNPKYLLCGYNNKHYDDVIINYINAIRTTNCSINSYFKASK